MLSGLPERRQRRRRSGFEVSGLQASDSETRRRKGVTSYGVANQHVRPRCWFVSRSPHLSAESSLYLCGIVPERSKSRGWENKRVIGLQALSGRESEDRWRGKEEGKGKRELPETEKPISLNYLSNPPPHCGLARTDQTRPPSS